MQIQTIARVQKVVTSTNWEGDKPTPIQGYSDVIFGTMDGKLKFKEIDNRDCSDFKVGQNYQLTYTITPDNDKYGSIVFKPYQIVNAEPAK